MNLVTLADESQRLKTSAHTLNNQAMSGVPNFKLIKPIIEAGRKLAGDFSCFLLGLISSLCALL